MITVRDVSSPTDEQLGMKLSRRERSAADLAAARDACEQLYARHARGLLAFLAARVRREDVEDAHQRVWQRAWDAAPRQFQGGNFRAWLYCIARNDLIDASRKKRALPLGPDEPLVDHRMGSPED